MNAELSSTHMNEWKLNLNRREQIGGSQGKKKNPLLLGKELNKIFALASLFWKAFVLKSPGITIVAALQVEKYFQNHAL